MSELRPHETGICLIGGTGRSGTTVLKRILANHPDATGMREYRITIDPDGIVDFYKSLKTHWTPYLFDHKLKKLHSLLKASANSNSLAKYYRYALRKSGLSKKLLKLESRYTDIGINQYCPQYSDYVSDLITSLREFKYKGTWTGQHFGEKAEISYSSYPADDQLAQKLGTFYRLVATSVAKRDQATHFVDDNTWNILYLRELLEIIPDAKLVHIYRDPRDVTASYIKQSWAPSDPVQAAQFCSSILSKWKQIKNEISDEAYHEVSLEKLVEETETVLKKITAFWGLSWNEALMKLDLSKSNRGRWKKDIPSVKKQKVQEILSEHLKDYGYE